MDQLSHLFSNNAAFIEELYQLYLENPQNVDDSWRVYFTSLSEDRTEAKRASDIINSLRGRPKVLGILSDEEVAAAKAKLANQNIDTAVTERSLKAIRLIMAFRAYGHLDVALDPLNFYKPKYHPELDYKYHDLTDADLHEDVVLGGLLGVDKVKFADLLHYLKSTYCNRIAAEFMHIESSEERDWIQRIMENSGGSVGVSKEEKLHALDMVTRAEMFENYLHVKFPGTKRFSVEGLENVISALKFIIEESVTAGVCEFIFGMAHRGRLNTLTNIMGKPFHSMFSEFKGELAFPADMAIPGDVKYHLGASLDMEIQGKKVHMSLTPNPSHLEVVNSVVVGKVRAKQDMIGDFAREKVLGILLHGDAAFAGQGSVMEAIALSQLQVYHTGGTIHVVTNNQIGFTTDPQDSRSTNYATDIAKFISVPIFHVNGDDAEAVVFISKLAAQYRAKFKKDVVIDIVGYRKYGHNEGDEPFFTQPVMYSIIKGKKNPAEVYAEKLISNGEITADYYSNLQASFKQLLDAEFEKSKDYKPAKADWLEGGVWSKFNNPMQERNESATGVDAAKLRKLGLDMCKVRDGFAVNPKIAKQIEAREAAINKGEGLDWATGELLAYATLLDEGFSVRMTGQDVERGTFSHRHAILTDQNTQEKYPILNTDKTLKDKGYLEIKNSNLSEFGVMGFEYGYSITNPNTLTIWEGQFGDFANGAQVIIDQYLTSGEVKWLRMSGLVLLLPHGYEGQGPEHSSARLERFLQLCAQDNITVANCTTPASLFHILRRQMHRSFRKPLVIMSPKSLLRHKLVISDMKDIAKGTTFMPVLDDTKYSKKASSVKKLVLCSGKVYYDVLEKREELKRDDIALVRLEQLYPFPADELNKILKAYNNAEVVWVQEEHKNMGAYSFVARRIEDLLAAIRGKFEPIRYIGRAESASPAVGYMKLHTVELAKFMNEIFN